MIAQTEPAHHAARRLGGTAEEVERIVGRRCETAKGGREAVFGAIFMSTRLVAVGNDDQLRVAALLVLVRGGEPSIGETLRARFERS